MVAFPLSPVPAAYGKAAWTDAAQPRNGIFYVGGSAPTVKLSKAGATGYSVRDYDGNVVTSGSINGIDTTIVPTAPLGGWDPGWYRAYFTGPSNDALFGNSYAITNFVVLRNDSHFLPTPAGNTNPLGGAAGAISEACDPVAKAVFGIGTSRILIANAADPTDTGTPDRLEYSELLASVGSDYWTDPGAQYLDPARTRYLWLAFVNATYDSLALPGASSGTYLTVYCKDGTVDGSQVFVKLEAGSSSGRKITVRFPDAVTVAETYDNQANAAAAAAAINAASSYIKVFTSNSSAGGTLAETAVGNDYFSGVSLVVSTVYPEGVTRFEGPSNEPALNAEAAHKMRLFQAAVHDGNASAKAIGPCPVSISNLSEWRNFLDAGGGTYCDEFAFHAYGATTNGDLNLGRHTLDAFYDMLADYGLGSKVCWQTEATQAMTPVYGVHHPRRARVQLLQTLLLEQYGIPRERNNPWYDTSHGFWAHPTWLFNNDGSPQPQAAMARVLAEETWGQLHYAALDFGGLADNIFLGSRYDGASTSTLVLMTTSYIPGATVTIATNAAGPLTVVDAWGNTSSVTVSGGRATIPVREIPTYVRLALANTATVTGVNDWSTVFSDADDVALSMICTIDGATQRTINSGGFITDYGPQTGIYRSSGEVPITVQLKSHSQFYEIERVLIWAGSAWQLDSTPLAFEVEVTQDMATWESVATVDVSSGATAFVAGSDFENLGCQYETYWDEQWVFDVPLPADTVAIAARVTVTATSFGGEPTADCVTAGGQGDSDNHLVLQRVALLGTEADQPAGPAVTEIRCRTLRRV